MDSGTCELCQVGTGPLQISITISYMGFLEQIGVKHRGRISALLFLPAADG